MPEETIISKSIRVRGDLVVGDYSIIDDYCYFAADVEIGKYVHIAHNVTVLGSGYKCKIGDFSAIGPGVRIACVSDDYEGGIAGPRIPHEYKGHPLAGNVVIGRHCVIGANSVILPGVVIPEGVGIGALSLVRPTDKLEPYGLYAGCPIRFLRYRKSNETLEKQFLDKSEFTIPFIQPDLTRAEAQAAYDTVLSGLVNEGKLAQRFSEEFARVVGSKYAVPMTNCTTAIALALMALEIEDKEVIVPDITMIGTAMGVVLSGNKPVVVDVNLEDGCINPAKILEVVTNQTAAVIPVHYSGRNAINPRLLDIASNYHLAIVEDAAGCLGSRAGREGSAQLGTTGEFGCFSLAATKIAVSGQGGVLVTNDASLYEKATRLKDWGRFEEKGIHHGHIGFNFKLTDIQAAIALVQLERLPALVKRKGEIYARYKERIGDLMFSKQDHPGYCPWYVEIKDQSVASVLSEHNIGCSPIWPALHQQRAMKLFVEPKDERFPNATALAEQILWLPSSTKLTDDEIDFICDVIQGVR